MDEKELRYTQERLPGDGKPTEPELQQRAQRQRWLGIVLGLVLGVVLWRNTRSLFYPHYDLNANPTRSHKVALEAHIMSKCPDAKVCLEELVVPVMANISEKVDFALSYIGSTTTDHDAVECMHGPEECLGNIIELCAANLYPDPLLYLGFTMCLTRDQAHIPQKELVHSCALEHSIDFDSINRCASKDDGAFGMDLLRNSVARSANAGVTKSCTVRLNNEIRCIRDGGEWKDCPGGSTVEDLIRDIKKASKAKKTTHERYGW